MTSPTEVLVKRSPNVPGQQQTPGTRPTHQRGDPLDDPSRPPLRKPHGRDGVIGRDADPLSDQAPTLLRTLERGSEGCYDREGKDAAFLPSRPDPRTSKSSAHTYTTGQPPNV